jgi:hypothetical protein
MTWETILQSIRHKPIRTIQFYYDLYNQGRKDEIFRHLREESIRKEEEERMRYMDELENQRYKYGVNN